MGYCLMMRKGEVHTAPVTYKANFADNTWEQIIDACHKNKVPATWAVGNQKPMTINGTAYAIDIIGKGHDDYADGSGKAPLTFQMHDCYGEEYAMNGTNTNSGGWTNCAMRKTHLPAILSKMPTEVQSGIREINKKVGVGGGASSGIESVNDYLFLLGEVEIFGVTNYTIVGEGTQYDYYKAGNSKVKKRNGTSDAWWERSPLINRSVNFCATDSSGARDYINATYKRGVAFAFCF